MTRSEKPGVGRQPWIAWLCAAPMPFIGVAAGLFLSSALFNRQVAARLAESPDEYVCGLSALPFLFLGLIGGSRGGIVAGAAIAERVTRLVRGRGTRNAAKSVTPELPIPKAGW